MPPPFHITTPLLSVEEVAERAGVSPERTKELIELAHRMVEGSKSTTVRKTSKQSSVKGLGRKKRK